MARLGHHIEDGACDVWGTQRLHILQSLLGCAPLLLGKVGEHSRVQ